MHNPAVNNLYRFDRNSISIVSQAVHLPDGRMDYIHFFNIYNIKLMSRVLSCLRFEEPSMVSSIFAALYSRIGPGFLE